MEEKDLCSLYYEKVKHQTKDKYWKFDEDLVR